MNGEAWHNATEAERVGNRLCEMNDEKLHLILELSTHSTAEVVFKVLAFISHTPHDADACMQ